eukprot:symbB.v1.2.017057.t1/scaffold1314.1/size125707/10
MAASGARVLPRPRAAGPVAAGPAAATLGTQCALHKQRVVPALWPFALSAKSGRPDLAPAAAGRHLGSTEGPGTPPPTELRLVPPPLARARRRRPVSRLQRAWRQPEILLQFYGGLRFAAELAAQADTFRHANLPPPRRARAPRRGGRGRGAATGRLPATTPPPAAPPAATVLDPAPTPEPSAAAIAAGLASLDAVDLLAAFHRRVYTFQYPPRPLQGILAFAFRKGLQPLLSSQPNSLQCERGWKLFLLTPRMLLYRPRGNASIPATDLRRRAASFQAGRWLQLLNEAAEAAAMPVQTTAMPANVAEPSTAARCTRAVTLAQQGELSAASHALTSDPLADSTLATLHALQDRPAQPVHPIPAAHLTDPCPGHALSADLFIRNLQRARRGAAPGPSGCTNAHLRVLLNSEDDISLLHQAAQHLVDAAVPPPILAALRLGRMVALRKGDGRVRGLVLGDTFRRLLSRTLAQTFGAAFDAACAPHQFALSTRAGAEALTRAVRARLALDDQATIVSIDGVGAYDHVSRAAILAALHQNPHLTGSSTPRPVPTSGTIGTARPTTWRRAKAVSKAIL